MIKLNKLLGPEVVRQLLVGSVAHAVESRITRGRKMRVDTTVVEARIRYPLDSRLLEDGIRVLSRGMRRLQATGVKIAGGVRDVSRSVSRALRNLAAGLKTRKRDERREAILKPYRRLLRIAGRVVRQASSVVASAGAQVQQVARLRGRARSSAQRTVEQLETFIGRVRQVIRQTRARLFGKNPRSEGKLASIFEPWVDILRRGKRHRPTEFGKLVKVQESDGGIVTDIGVAEGKADAPLLVPSVERHLELFGKVPWLVAADRGFYSAKGENELREMKVRHPVIPKPGRVSAARRAHENQRWFKRGRAWRAGGEGRISYLKNRFGMRRSSARGADGLEQTTLWAGIANNLAVMARSGPTPTRN